MRKFYPWMGSTTLNQITFLSWLFRNIIYDEALVTLFNQLRIKFKILPQASQTDK